MPYQDAPVKLCDFGFAKIDQGDLMTPQFTPYYVAPQVRPHWLFRDVNADHVFFIFTFKGVMSQKKSHFLFFIKKGQTKSLISLFKRCLELNSARKAHGHVSWVSLVLGNNGKVMIMIKHLLLTFFNRCWRHRDATRKRSLELYLPHPHRTRTTR